jgi:predicted DNA-binding ribbon-helix-helix protein
VTALTDASDRTCEHIAENPARSLMLVTARNSLFGYYEGLCSAELGPAEHITLTQAGNEVMADPRPADLDHQDRVFQAAVIRPPCQPGWRMRLSSLFKRSFSLAGHRTSVALEEEFWAALIAIAAVRGQSLSALVASTDAEREAGRPLASALRVLALREAPRTADSVSATPGS